MPTDDPTTEAAQVRTDALAEARKVSATLFEHAAETERLGRPAPATVTALQQSGLLALSVPRQFGGQEAGLGTQARVALELGRGCPSVGWVASLSGAAKGMVAPMLAPATRTAFFDDPHAFVCASGVGNGRALRQNGDLRVSGRWRMASGCEVATWASLLVTVHDENDQVVEAGVVLARVEELQIDRGWRSAGLQGTGSYRLVADNLLIPATFSAVGPVAGPPSAPPARVSLGAVVAHLAPLVGATSGQLEASRALFSGDRVPSRTTYTQLVDSPLARDWFARAERAVGAAVRDTLAVADAWITCPPARNRRRSCGRTGAWTWCRQRRPVAAPGAPARPQRCRWFRSPGTVAAGVAGRCGRHPLRRAESVCGGRGPCSGAARRRRSGLAAVKRCGVSGGSYG